jgi:cyclophilin family peptidyl-prolyl cis-trans isomerase
VQAYQKRRARRRGFVTAVIIALLVGLVIAVVNPFGGSSSKKKVSSTTPTTAKAVDLKPPPEGAAITGDTPCPKADGSSPRTTKFAKPPPMCIDVKKSYTAAMKTSKGVITIALDDKKTPKTVNNFVVLARYHFFDGIAFHRIVPDFVVQAGDPDENGSGGPGYKFEDELPGPGGYKTGAVAMANSGPNTNGSQFFIVTSDKGGGGLQPSYSLFGHVTDGLAVVDTIGKLGNADQKPTERITIDSVTITET